MKGLRDWADGGPLDPPERGDWASAVEAARAWLVKCPECGSPRFLERPDDDGVLCDAWEPCGWQASEEELVEAWAGAHEVDPAERNE